ncbi:hypothetical protein EV127DRAFT_343074, partial [Xylaria flabelliformis]
YNLYLDGKQVDQINISQDVVIQVGTAFAFLVKTGLTAAVVTSYIQRVWANLKTQSFEVRHVDTMMGAPSDVFALLDPRPWIRVPGLALLGIAIWCIPLTAVVTPGTLTVITHPDSRTENLSVPQLSYDSSTWTDTSPPGLNQAEFYGASKAVEWAGLESAITGEILKIPSYQYFNQSYRIAFNGPAIRCSNANDTVRSAAKERVEILSAKNITDLSYLSWAGTDDHGFLTPISDSNTIGLSGVFSSSPYSPLDIRSSNTCRIFFYATSNPVGNAGYPAGFKVSNNVSECLLYNTLYDVNFDFTNGVSSLTIKNLTYEEKIPLVTQTSTPSPIDGALSTRLSYLAVMSVFGSQLVGFAGDGTVLYTSFQRTLVDWSTLEGTQRGLERLFQNMTLSMLLLSNSTQSPQIPVTITTYPLTYRYKRRDPWISYGSGILVALVVTSIGINSVMMNSASYSAKFSTSMRVVKNVGLHHLLKDDDDGSDQIPKTLAKARVKINGDGVLVMATHEESSESSGHT